MGLTWEVFWKRREKWAETGLWGQEWRKRKGEMGRKKEGKRLEVGRPIFKREGSKCAQEGLLAALRMYPVRTLRAGQYGCLNTNTPFTQSSPVSETFI